MSWWPFAAAKKEDEAEAEAESSSGEEESEYEDDSESKCADAEEDEDDIITPSAYPLHSAIIMRNMDWLKSALADLPKAKAGSSAPERPINCWDHHGYTPLTLCVLLGWAEGVDELLAAGAYPSIKSRDGWTATHEAISTSQRVILRKLMLRNLELAQLGLGDTGPLVKEHLAQKPDFYLEIDWKFVSWIPFVSRFCPSDKFKVWKRGADIRVDISLIDFENYSWKRGHVSFLFINRSDGEVEFHVLNHSEKTRQVTLQQDEFALDEEETERNVENLLQSDCITPELITDDIIIKKEETWLGRPKVITIHDEECRAYKLKHLTVLTRRKNSHVPEAVTLEMERKHKLLKKKTKKAKADSETVGTMTEDIKEAERTTSKIRVDTAADDAFDAVARGGFDAIKKHRSHDSLSLEYAPSPVPRRPCADRLRGASESSSSVQQPERGRSRGRGREREPMPGVAEVKEAERVGSPFSFSDEDVWKHEEIPQSPRSQRQSSHSRARSPRPWERRKEEMFDNLKRYRYPPWIPVDVTLDNYFSIDKRALAKAASAATLRREQDTADLVAEDPEAYGKVVKKKKKKKKGSALKRSRTLSKFTRKRGKGKGKTGAASKGHESEEDLEESAESSSSDESSSSSSETERCLSKSKFTTTCLLNPAPVMVTSKTFKLHLAMVDKFGVTIEEVITILEAAGPRSKLIQQLSQFLKLEMPPGFPIRLELPLFYVLKAIVTFESFEERTVSADIFKIPEEYEKIALREPPLGASH